MTRQTSGPTAVRIERQGAVWTVVLSRPDARNAVDGRTAHDLAHAFLAFEQDETARVGVLFGDHGTFSAGADLKSVARGEGNPLVDPKTGGDFDRLDGAAPMGPTRLVLSKPVIAAIAGHAVAGGLELALWCDLRVMESDAVLGVFCRRWGVPLIDGGTVRLPRLIGLSRALDLILTGRPVGAEEALAMGLANRVAPKGEARAVAEALAVSLARFPPQCLSNDRRSVYDQADLPFDEAMAREFALGRATLASGEAVEGAQRFAEGRGRAGRFDDL